MDVSVELLPIRPYARLLTMLGEQLIKNDRIALVELVKNSYDADASNVTLSFDGFGPGLATTPNAVISVTDDGSGMTDSTVKEAWLSPATSIKSRAKRADPKSAGGRVIQGEKGIGRFAMFKLGARVALITRAKDAVHETVVDYDISFLDHPEDRVASGRLGDEVLLEDLQVAVTTREPILFNGSDERVDCSTHGTRIEVRSIRSQWSTKLLAQCHQDLLRLQPLTGLLTGRAGDDPLGFAVEFRVDQSTPEYLSNPEVLLESLSERAVLQVVGSFNASTGSYSATVNDEDRIVRLDSTEIRGLRAFRDHFGEDGASPEVRCGDYEFEFLVFDLRPNASTNYLLDPDQRELVKNHRIYLYRNGIRVLPYGDPDDDWLQLDVIRGTQGADRVLSNDQTLGFVYITQAENPELRDKTNREGLIDSGQAYADFKATLQIFVTYLRKGDFARYLTTTRRRDDAAAVQQAQSITADLKSLRSSITGGEARESLDRITRAYDVERRFLTERVSRTEDLAGVGLSVETASHDIVSAAGHALRDARIVQTGIRYELGADAVIYVGATGVVDSLSFIVSRLQDVQGLFVSSRQKPRVLDVAQYARKIEAIYRRLLSDVGISVTYSGSSKLEVKTVEATLLQVFLNLMDNAVYWLRASRTSDPRIDIVFDAESMTVNFSDNGPGVANEDAPYIFDAFYSAKGDEGRGLGLFIAREVAERSGFQLDLAAESASPLGGATFVLRLVKS